MAELLGVITVIAFVVAALAWRVREGRRHRSAERDDTVRVGEAVGPNAHAAARHAEGVTAWTRISGP